MHRALITGGAGQLAFDLRRVLTDAGTEVLAADRAQLDISQPAQVAAVFASFRPTMVFNCAAYNNVDAAESDAQAAFAINALAVKTVAQACADHDAKLVHYSTNYVFDGRHTTSERHLPRPLSVYGASKLAGEQLALAYAPGALVIRSAGLYGLASNASKGGNFVERVLAHAREHGQLQMVSDQFLNPTHTLDLAHASLQAVSHDAAGALHVINPDGCTWIRFALEILGLAGLGDIPVAEVRTEPRPGVAVRPRDGRMVSERFKELELTPLRDWPTALAEYMQAAGLSA